MAHIFKYAVLMAIPDPARGERVNVGLVIFREDRMRAVVVDIVPLSRECIVPNGIAPVNVQMLTRQVGNVQLSK